MIVKYTKRKTREVPTLIYNALLLETDRAQHCEG
jgi:hypothetical protein